MDKSGIEIPTVANEFGSRFIVANCADVVQGSLNCLFDSGSECSLVCNKVLSSKVPIFEQFKVKISGIENGFFYSLGLVLLLLKFKHTFILQEFQVISDQYFKIIDALLGSDF